jgi:AcrR family transcriptional regulator
MPAMPKQERGQRTLKRVLRRAVQLASIEGLEGITIGRLAGATGLSKGGLFAHFGSKEALQLALIEEARAVFTQNVIEAAQTAEPGLPRLMSVQRNWIDYIRGDSFRGGCFFASAHAEFDGRPGPVKSRLVALARQWRDIVETEAMRAVELGHLRAETDPARLAFALHAFVQEANWSFQLLGDEEAFARARAESEQRIRREATADGLRAVKSRRVVPAEIHPLNVA